MRLDLPEESAEWRRRADALRQAIGAKLRNPDGTFAYFLHPNGVREARREVLGSAFPVLCGVVEGEEARAAVGSYPITPHGAPLLDPFYPGEGSLHNNSTWPFADTFLFLALERCSEASEIDHLRALNRTICEGMAPDGHMHEFYNTQTHAVTGQTAQLWSVAALLSTLIRSGYTDADADLVRIH